MSDLTYDEALDAVAKDFLSEGDFISNGIGMDFWDALRETNRSHGCTSNDAREAIADRILSLLEYSTTTDIDDAYRVINEYHKDNE